MNGSLSDGEEIRKDNGQALNGSCKSESGARSILGCAYRILGEMALKTNPADASPHFGHAIFIFREIKADNDLALAYSGMGRLRKLRGEYAEARRHLTDALEIFERLGTLIEPDKVRKELAELPSYRGLSRRGLPQWIVVASSVEKLHLFAQKACQPRISA